MTAKLDRPGPEAGREALSRNHFRVLAYVRNLPDYYRLEYALPGLTEELEDLRQKGWITATQETDHSRFTWTRLRITQDRQETTDKLLAEEYYPNLTG